MVEMYSAERVGKDKKAHADVKTTRERTRADMTAGVGAWVQRE